MNLFKLFRKKKKQTTLISCSTKYCKHEYVINIFLKWLTKQINHNKAYHEKYYKEGNLVRAIYQAQWVNALNFMHHSLVELIQHTEAELKKPIVNKKLRKAIDWIIEQKNTHLPGQLSLEDISDGDIMIVCSLFNHYLKQQQKKLVKQKARKKRSKNEREKNN